MELLWAVFKITVRLSAGARGDSLRGWRGFVRWASGSYWCFLTPPKNTSECMFFLAYGHILKNTTTKSSLSALSVFCITVQEFPLLFLIVHQGLMQFFCAFFCLHPDYLPTVFQWVEALSFIGQPEQLDFFLVCCTFYIELGSSDSLLVR